MGASAPTASQALARRWQACGPSSAVAPRVRLSGVAVRLGEGQPLDGVSEVLTAAEEARLTPLGLHLLMVSAAPEDGTAPADWLAAGKRDYVVELVAGGFERARVLTAIRSASIFFLRRPASFPRRGSRLTSSMTSSCPVSTGMRTRYGRSATLAGTCLRGISWIARFGNRPPRAARNRPLADKTVQRTVQRQSNAQHRTRIPRRAGRACPIGPRDPFVANSETEPDALHSPTRSCRRAVLGLKFAQAQQCSWCYAIRAGKATVTASPPPSWARSVSVAPWASAMARTIDSPRPWRPSPALLRPGCRRWNGSSRRLT